MKPRRFDDQRNRKLLSALSPLAVAALLAWLRLRESLPGPFDVLPGPFAIEAALFVNHHGARLSAASVKRLTRLQR
jgi:hypothetical protein